MSAAFGIEYNGPALRRLVRQLDRVAGVTPAEVFTLALPDIDAAFTKTQQRYYASLGGRYVDTGRLKASLTNTGDRDHVARIVGGRVQLGTRVPYAAKLDRDYGAKYGPVIRLRGGAISSVVLQPLRRAFDRLLAEVPEQ